MNPAPIRLVVRADDAGSFLSANDAIEQSIDAGLVRNVSVMVPGPAFEDAARRLAGRTGVCLGLHITLNAELQAPKWGPVASPATVPSLLDTNGFFLRAPADTHRQGLVVEEAMREIEAQLSTARRAGLNISYVDEHMGVSWIGIREQIADMCRREGLIDVHGLDRLSLGQSLEEAREHLSTAAAGTYVWVTHPGILSPETARIHVEGRPDDGTFVAARDAERRLLTDPALAALFQEFKVQPVRYSEI